MTPGERARMRETLRDALSHTHLPGAGLDHPGRIELPPRPSAADLVARFAKELAAVGGVLHDASSLDDVAAIVLARFGADDSRELMMWDESHLPIAGIGDALARAGVTIRTQAAGDFESHERRAALMSVDVGLTGADAGLAETGSIVVVSGRGRSRLASLLPPVHVALLARDRLTSSLAALIRERPELSTAGANFVCITGPSRTADIEHTLTRGVHGPKEVHVVMVG